MTKNARTYSLLLLCESSAATCDNEVKQKRLRKTALTGQEFPVLLGNGEINLRHTDLDFCWRSAKVGGWFAAR